MSFRNSPPSAVSYGADRLDVFYRTAEDSLACWRQRNGRWVHRDLGGTLASAPSAVAMERDQVVVVARAPDHTMQRWYLSGDTLFGPAPFAKFLTADPVAIADGTNTYLVMSPSVDGPLRLWQGAGGTVLHSADPLADWAGIRPTGAQRIGVDLLSGEFDVVWRTYQGTLVRRIFRRGLQEWTAPEPLGGHVTGVPAAASWSGQRLDVVARDDAGVWSHWGWNGLRWFGPENNAQERLDSDPVMVSRGPDDLHVFARGADGSLRHWQWDPAARYWVSPQSVGSGLVSDPVAVVRGPDVIDVFAWSDGPLLHWSGDGRSWEEERLSPGEPESVPEPRPATKPDFLLRRPRDLLLIGLKLPGFEPWQGGPELAAVTDDARIVVLLPPQHLAEETAGGVPRRALLSGPSRLVFGLVDGIGVLAPLTAEGILDLVGGQPLQPGDAPDPDLATAIELPWRMRAALEADTDITSDHASLPAAAPDGSVGLWRARLYSQDRLPTQAAIDAGLLLRNVDPALAAVADPFEVPLPRAQRRMITAQGTPAQAQRVDLSTLGGALSVRQAWEALVWEHRTNLGRDLTVRTTVNGRLFPLGFRAQYAELTERIIDPHGGPAVLRTRSVLTITEPVLHPERGGRAWRHFPFAEVEATASSFTVDRPTGEDWATWPRPIRSVAGLAQLEAELRARMKQLERTIYGGDMGYHDGPVVEELAETMPEAADYLALRADLIATAAMLEELRLHPPAEAQIDLYFWPHAGGTEVRFPIRLQARNAGVHVQLPMMFVADRPLTDTAQFPAYDPMADPAVLTALQQAHQQSGHHVVELPGAPLAVFDDGRFEATDVHEVHRLNIAGLPADIGGFRPSLGPDPAPDRMPIARGLPAVPQIYPPWGFEADLPAVRTLLGEERRTLLRFTDDYLKQGEAVDAALQMTEPLGIDFTHQADRAGALVAPQLLADGISRNYGPVQLAGIPDPSSLVPGVPARLTPQDVLGQAATLLGMNLADMIGELPEPPAILSELTRRPPVIRMEWREAKLKTHRPFIARDGSTLLLEVESSAERTRTHCEITNFALVMPPDADLRDPPLRLDFDALTYTQEGTSAPDLKVTGLHIAFGGSLKLIEGLLEKVDLLKAALHVHTSSTEITADYTLPIPAAKAGAFLLSGISFHAGVRVPFDDAPVVRVGFSSRADPFHVAVLMFGGGGYLDMEIDKTGVRRLEISLEFGAMVAVDFVVAQGEVHALGGVTCVVAPGGAELTGYLRFGGCVEVLGLLTVSIELRVALRAVILQPSGAVRLTGRATLVLEIDLTLLSESVELDSGEWEIIGGDSHTAFAAAEPTDWLADWRAYRTAFAEEAPQ